MGYRLNCLDEPVFMAVTIPLLTDLGIHHRLESCAFDIASGAAKIQGHRTLGTKVTGHCQDQLA